MLRAESIEKVSLHAVRKKLTQRFFNLAYTGKTTFVIVSVGVLHVKRRQINFLLSPWSPAS